MTAGALRSAITLEARSEEPSGASGTTVNFAPVAETWGSVRGVKEQAFAEGVGVADAVTHVIRIRWRAREGFDHVLGDAGRRWVVRGVRDPDDRRRWLDLFCTELAPEVET